MAGELITQNWQAEVGGLLLGDGTDFIIEKLDAAGRPRVRTSDISNPSADGTLTAGPDLLDGRTIVLNVALAADDAAAVSVLLDQLDAAWQMQSAGTVPLVWRQPGVGQVRANGRPRAFEVDDTLRRVGLIRVTAGFYCADPRLYGDALKSQAFDASGPVGGSEWDAPWPMVWTAESDPSETDLTNAGSRPTPPLWTITGPCVTPRLELVGSAFLEFDLTLSAGQTIVVDVLNRTATIDGVGKVSTKTLRSTWWELPAGTSTVRFRSYDLSGTATMTWRDAR